MGRTILIADDEPHVLRLLVRVFEREGDRVLSAPDGDRAAEVFDEHADEIDVLVLDVIIPPRGAGAILEHVLAKRPELKIVLASGDHLGPELSELLESRGGAFLQKPFMPDALLRTVAELCGPGE